jgi:hypothetical protein
MKSSCLVRTLIITTILFAAIFYFFTHLPTSVKEMVINFGLKKTKERLEKVEATEQQKLIVRQALQAYTEKLGQQNNISLNQVNEVADTLGKILEDNVITSEESQNFKNYIEEVMKNERRKKD